MSEFFVNDQRPDDDGTLQYYPRMTTFEQLQAVMPVKVSTHYGWDATPNGHLCWKIVGFNVRTAAPIFFPRVLGLDGTPFYNPATNSTALVLHTWAGCDEFPTPEPLRPDYNALLHDLTGDGFAAHRALYNWSKRENGDADFAFGLGMQYGEGMKGAGAIWVSAVPAHIDPSVGAHYSDCSYNMGWLGGTNYLTWAPVFHLTRKEGTPTPTPTGNELLVNVAADGTRLGWMEFQSGPAPSGTPALTLVRDDTVIAHLPWNEGPPPSTSVLARIARALRG